MSLKFAQSAAKEFVKEEIETEDFTSNKLVNGRSVSFCVKWGIFYHGNFFKLNFDLIPMLMLHILAQRISIPEIRNHTWFRKNLPGDLMDDWTMGKQFDELDGPVQSLESIMQIMSEATIPPAGMYTLDRMYDYMDDDMDDDLDSDPDLDIDSSGEVIYAM